METLVNKILPLYPFDAFRVEEIESKLDAVIAEYRATILRITENPAPATWESVAVPLDDAADRFHRFWTPVVELNHLIDLPRFREVFETCQNKVTAFSTELGQNAKLYNKCASLKASPEFLTLARAEQKIVNDALRDFRRSGIALPKDKRERFKEINKRLATLAQRFENNLKDSRSAWTKHVTDKQELSGLPEQLIQEMRKKADTQNLPGWIVWLDGASYPLLITYADNRKLREEVRYGWITAASDLGISPEKWDNTPFIEEICALRYEMAQLLGFNNFAEYSTDIKMAKIPETALALIERLAERAKPFAEKEYAELKAFALETLGLHKLEAWDIAYASEKLREALYDYSEKEVRNYFPLPKVIEGMVKILERLYGVTLLECYDIAVWHKDVRFFEVHSDHKLIGGLYMDLYARGKEKKGGAWMDGLAPRRMTVHGLQLPVGLLSCNFTEPTKDTPSLLNSGEVKTLFHEMGHNLHLLLGETTHTGSSMLGVEWDAIELPSQLFEAWAFHEETTPLISGHYKIGEPLPNELLEKILAAKNFQNGLVYVRQFELGLFDLLLFRDYDPECGARAMETLRAVRQKIGVIPYPDYDRFPQSFAHIFAGGYGAGYFSYAWAETMVDDCLARFKDGGMFNEETAREYRREILAVGSSRPFKESFEAFRGRELDPEAFFRRKGF